MNNIYLFQPQYAVDIRAETNYWIPYSVGSIWSYAQQFDVIKENFTLKELIFKRETPQDIIDRLDNPAICGFSCYVWNRNYCLEIARLIKQKWPDCLIVFGGADVNPSILKYEFIDSIIVSEGELHFTELLTAVANKKQPERVYLKSRLENLDFPSPYSTGVFDDIVKNNPNAVWAMTLETNRGCPYQCTFCDWGGLTYSKVRKFDLGRIQGELDWATANSVGYMFLADANFGIFKDRDVEIAKMIKQVSEKGSLEKVSLTYAKNSTDVVFTIAQELGDLNKGVTFSVQSMNDDTLTAIKRKNMDVNNISELMKLSQEYNVSTYTETIVGLPEETIDSWKQGFADILEMGQHNAIEVWPCQLLENSELNTFESRLKYGIKSIVAQDFTPFCNESDYTDIIENITLVNKTATMSTDDLVDAYMYGWMMMQFHYTGYTQLIAKYCRYVLNVPYRKFYDTLYTEIQNDVFFAPKYSHLKTNINHYLRVGTFIDKKIAGHSVTSTYLKEIYFNRDHTYKVGRSTALRFSSDIDDIDSIQQLMIYDENLVLPKIINSPWDLDTWTHTPTKYTINTRQVIDQKFDFYIARRNGLLKNIFVKG